jgi:hypothetical protein
MPIFKLANVEDNIDRAILIPATKTNLELEKYLLRGFGGATWGGAPGQSMRAAGRAPDQASKTASLHWIIPPHCPTNSTLIFKSSR